MSASTYLLLLRPWKTLGLASVYCLLTWSSLGAVFHLSWEPRWLLSWLVVAPFLLGAFSVAPLHEVLHLRGSLMLPKLGAALRRWHLIAGGVVVWLFAGLTKAFVPEVPFVASVGLASAAFALPCFNRHRRGWLDAYAWGVLALVALVSVSGARRVYDFSLAQPWTVGVAGLAIAQAALLAGFSRRSIRSRQKDYFASFQSRLFCPKIAERSRKLLVDEKGRRERSRTWCYGQNDGSLFSWLRVAWYVRLGHRRHPWLTLVLASLLVPLQVVAAASVFMFLDGGAASPKAWFDALISLGETRALGGETETKVAVFVLVLTPMLSLCVAISDLFPRLHYPLSRTRTAELHFAFTMIQVVVAFFAPLLAFLAAFWLALALTGRGLGVAPLAPVATPSLVMLVFVPLILLAEFFRNKWLYIAVAIAVGVVGVAGAAASFFFPEMLSLGGAVGGAALFGCFAALYRYRLERHYATGDLVLEASPGIVPGFVGGSSRS